VRFQGRIRELVAGHPSLEAIAQSLLAVRVALRREFDRFEKQVLAMACCDTRARLLMPVSCVGAIVSLTFVAAIDDPARVKSSCEQVGAYFGLTPTKYQSGETDIDGRISKIGDASVRTVLYQAANIILTRPLKGCTALKSWAMNLARRSGMTKARVALSRKSPSSCIGCWSMAQASVTSRRSEWRLRIVTQIMMPRYAGAASGLRRRDATEPRRPPFHQTCLVNLVEEGAITPFRADRDTSLPERGPDAGMMDQVRPQHGSLVPTTRR
jgi:Transposase IS116/IS110/IS902 family